MKHFSCGKVSYLNSPKYLASADDVTVVELIGIFWNREDASKKEYTIKI